MKRLLNIWIEKDQLFNSRKYKMTSIQEFNSKIEYLSSSLPYNIFNRHPRSTFCFILESNRISVIFNFLINAYYKIYRCISIIHHLNYNIYF